MQPDVFGTTFTPPLESLFLYLRLDIQTLSSILLDVHSHGKGAKKDQCKMRDNLTLAGSNP